MVTRRNFFATASLALAAAGCRSFVKDDAGSIVRGQVNFKLGMAGYSCNRLSLDDTLALLKRLDVNYLCIKDFHLPLAATDADIAVFTDVGVNGEGLFGCEGSKIGLIFIGKKVAETRFHIVGMNVLTHTDILGSNTDDLTVFYYLITLFDT